MKKQFFISIIAFCVCSFSCQKDDETIELNESDSSQAFMLSSPMIGTDSILPLEYTCDGEGATLPLEWEGYPEETECFALIMHHEAAPEDIHWYWIIYNIPATINSLPENVSDVGILGNNSVNGITEYAPPCSQGPGEKTYIYTVYALSEEVDTDILPSDVNLTVISEEISDITLSSAKMEVTFTRY